MKKTFFLFLFITCVPLFLPFNDYALSDADIEKQNEIKLVLGQLTTVPVNHPRRINIANPNIADVTGITREEITITPKAVGRTSLDVWDKFGEESFDVKVFAENIDQVKERVDNLLSRLDYPEVYTQAAEDEGKVLLLGRVKTAQDKEKINFAIGILKDKIVDLIKVREEETIIEIDVQVLELDKDATNTLGITNPLSTTAGITITEVGTPGISSLGAKWSTLFKVANLERGTYSSGTVTPNPFAWTLYALIQEGKARILSRPRLACQSGKEAELMVGGEKPVFTSTVAATTGATGTEVEYKEYGIKLKIKPTITEKEKIKLSLNVDVSEVGSPEYIGQATNRTAQAYPLTKRSATTELFLNNGQTMAIGGLMKQKTEEDIIRTPWLSDIPIIGFAFRKKQVKTGGGSGERGNVELFITLTPTIVSRDKSLVEEQKAAKMNVSQGHLAAAGTASANALTPETEYAKIIQDEIMKSLLYPSGAKEAGFEGKLILSLHLSYKGELLDTAVKSSSGFKILDDNAVAVARSINSFPPFPSGISEKDLWIDIPIEYRLN